MNRSTSSSAGTEGKRRQICTDTLTPTNPGEAGLGKTLPENQELQGRLTEILHRISGADPSVITSDARLMEDIGIDSLGFYEILIEADTSFGIRIKEEDLLKFRTVGDIQQHLESLNSQSTHADPS